MSNKAVTFELLVITVVGASNIPNKDDNELKPGKSGSASDPYVEVIIPQSKDRDNRLFATEEKSNESNPKYSKTKRYLLPAGTCPKEIEFRVIDKDVLTDDFIGAASTDKFSSDEQTLDLKDKDGKVVQCIVNNGKDDKDGKETKETATITVKVNKIELVDTVITDPIISDLNQVQKELEENTKADEKLKEDVEEVKSDIKEVKDVVEAQDKTDKDLADKDKEQDKVDEALQGQIDALRKDIMTGFDIEEKEKESYDKMNLGTTIKGRIDLLATKKETELLASKKDLELLASKEKVRTLQSKVSELENRLKIVIDGIARIAGKTGGISILYGATDTSGQKQGKK